MLYSSVLKILDGIEKKKTLKTPWFLFVVFFLLFSRKKGEIRYPYAMLCNAMLIHTWYMITCPQIFIFESKHLEIVLDEHYFLVIITCFNLKIQSFYFKWHQILFLVAEMDSLYPKIMKSIPYTDIFGWKTKKIS